MSRARLPPGVSPGNGPGVGLEFSPGISHQISRMDSPCVSRPLPVEASPSSGGMASSKARSATARNPHGFGTVAPQAPPQSDPVVETAAQPRSQPVAQSPAGWAGMAGNLSATGGGDPVGGSEVCRDRGPVPGVRLRGVFRDPSGNSPGIPGPRRRASIPQGSEGSANERRIKFPAKSSPEPRVPPGTAGAPRVPRASFVEVSSSFRRALFEHFWAI